MEFAFTVLDARGTKIQDRLSAETEDMAVRRLHGQGYVVLALAPIMTRRSAIQQESDPVREPFRGRRKRVRLDHIAALSREFAILIETGVPVIEALDALVEHVVHPVIREALATVRLDLSEGKSISQALREHPRIFPKLYVDMVRTAETGGKLHETLGLAADYLEAALEMRRKIVAALTYPAVLVVIATGVILFMLTYLLPQFGEMFVRMDTELPAITRILLALSAFLIRRWWTLPLFAAGVYYGFRALLRTPAGRFYITKTVHRTPLLGDTVNKIVLSRVFRALGTLLEAGVPLLTSLERSAQMAQDVLFEQALQQTRTQVEEGASLSEVIRQTRVFPGMVCQMLAVGEKSGRLSYVLLHLARYYEKEVDARLKSLASIIEPMMIVALGIVVGLIAVSIVVPIYSLVTNVH